MTTPALLSLALGLAALALAAWLQSCRALRRAEAASRMAGYAGYAWERSAEVQHDLSATKDELAALKLFAVRHVEACRRIEAVRELYHPSPAACAGPDPSTLDGEIE